MPPTNVMPGAFKRLTAFIPNLETRAAYTDYLGRNYQTVTADNSTTTSYYNALGQLARQVDPDGVTTLYAYNALGELEYTAVDLDQNGVMDLGGTDRVTRTIRSVGASSRWTGVNVRRTESWVWNTDGQDTPTLASVSETSVDGLRSLQASFGLTNTSQRVCLGEGQCITTNTAPDGTYTVTVQQAGHVTSVTRYSPSAQTLSATTYTYDAHGRGASVTDARTGTTGYTYDSADRVLSITTPTPAGGSAQTTTTLYDLLGRPWKTIQPDGTSVTNTYSATGERQRTSGSRTYPVEYTYDHAGRMKTMKTWRNFASDTGAAVTTWNYSASRGFLLSKQYADSQGPTYTYTAAGRLATRTWARGITTYYAYNPAGDLASVNYDDNLTPGITHTYDRRGRRLTAGSAGGPPAASSFTYNAAGQITSETFTSGLTVTNTYDTLLRRSSLTLQPFNSSTLYSYDSASRLATVSDGTNTATYTYVANSPLVSQIAFTQSGQPRMTTTKTYDALNRLTKTEATDPSTLQLILLRL